LQIRPGYPIRKTIRVLKIWRVWHSDYFADFPQYASLFALREFTYNNVTQANRNRLLWSEPTIDGMKTGQLSEVGWSIIATSLPGPRAPPMINSIAA
jgi:hypothetical protein